MKENDEGYEKMAIRCYAWHQECGKIASSYLERQRGYMSECKVEVVKISSLEKHPNADSLSIAKVYNYPVIVKTDEFQVPTLAAYFPVDAVLPDIDLFSFMWSGTRIPTEKKRRVKAIRLRKVFSMGLLMPLDKLKCAFGSALIPEPKVGDDISEKIGVHKYEEPEDFSLGGNVRRNPSFFPRYTDIENARKYASQMFHEDEEVIITEKIHGSNGRWAYTTGQDNKEDNGLWVGSHNLAKKNNDDNVWAVIAKKYDLETKLQTIPNMIVFGEVYGPVQKGFPYDSPNEVSMVVFDLYDITRNRYMDYDDARSITNSLGLKFVPELYRGRWSGDLDDILPIAEGPTILGNRAHIREGFVVKPTRERFHDHLGRVILKIHGEGFLTGKRRKK